ncbi:MAG: hypothetical protein JO131_07425 [Gammaproteobacteria bacterium]|nr:hypothetical protein [Gammaproteobacteria bacterium]
MYVVTKRFGRSETRLRDFNKEADAKQFIQDQLQDDIRFKLTASYGLYEGADLLQEFSQKDIIKQNAEDRGTSGESGSGQSGQGAGSRSSFSPTPFNTTPRPGGMPANWLKDEEENKDKK